MFPIGDRTTGSSVIVYLEEAFDSRSFHFVCVFTLFPLLFELTLPRFPLFCSSSLRPPLLVSQSLFLSVFLSAFRLCASVATFPAVTSAPSVFFPN